ncbi:MAG: GTPase Era [Acidobacteria bacterium]|nr:GTPase Era [Acidobacteriota bacterium]
MNADAGAEFRAGTVALVGRPNAGKSTLLNRMIGVKVSIVSDKPQTTRHRIRGVVTQESGQVVFVDTPGVHRPHYKMNRRMMDTTRQVLHEVDLVAVLVDVTESRGRGLEYMLNMVAESDLPVVLLLNKVDQLHKPELLPLIEWFSGKGEFVEIIPISALKGANCDNLVENLLRHLPPGAMLFGEDELTDRSERFIAAEFVREQLLNRTREELPYTTAVSVDQWTEPEKEGGSVVINATIYVDRPTQKPIVIGKGGKMLRAVGAAARHQIADLLGRPVHLELWVKVKPSWREQSPILDMLEIQS